MSRWYDRQGNPLPTDDLPEGYRRIEALLTSLAYKQVAQSTLPDGRWVSTVWLGIDHNFNENGPPLIFETMVFPNYGDSAEEYCERYSTDAEALEGHERIVRLYSEVS